MSKQSSASCVPFGAWSRHALVPVRRAMALNATGLRTGRLQRSLESEGLDRVEGGRAVGWIKSEADTDGGTDH